MRLEIQSTLLSGPGGPGEGAPPEVFEGKSAVDILKQMKAGSMFTDGLAIPQYVERVRMAVKAQVGVDLDCGQAGAKAGEEGDEELAMGLLRALEREGYAAIK